MLFWLLDSELYSQSWYAGLWSLAPKLFEPTTTSNLFHRQRLRSHLTMLTRDHIFSKVISGVWRGNNQECGEVIMTWSRLLQSSLLVPKKNKWKLKYWLFNVFWLKGLQWRAFNWSQNLVPGWTPLNPVNPRMTSTRSHSHVCVEVCLTSVTFLRRRQPLNFSVVRSC